MASIAPLTGSELFDCAKANGSKDIETVASRCGYGNDINAFEQALQQAGQHLGLEIHSFDDLTKPPQERETEGVEIAPESLGQL
jgi:hypothetical protein